MKKSRVRARKQSPLLEIRKPLRIRVYRGKFRPFESTKYLDVKALKAERKATIECGTIEAAGVKQTVSAVISDGKVVGLRPVACEGCTPTKGRRKVTPAELKQAMRQVQAKLADHGLDGPRKPTVLKISRHFGFEIPIGPIIIVIGEPPYGLDLCISWWDGNKYCWWCLLGPSGCIGFG
jgi:hypothetical protein